VSAIYEFGPFRYDAEQRLLFRDGEAVPLTPKAIDTLHALIERRGRVVEKAELMKLVWPDTTVEEIGLARNISTLRKALGDEADQGAIIETIPRRGYRFVAEVKLPGEQGAPAERVRRRRWLWAAPAAACALAGILIYWQFYRPSPYLPRGEGYASLAVMPFECLSPELAQAAFAEGLNEQLAASLAKLERVHVTSPSTVRRYRDLRIPASIMARMLGLDVILEGAVQRSGGKLLVTARLADVHSGKLIWAESYEQPAEDAAAAGAGTARQIAAQVGAHLAVRERVR
jgi:DNA-binding winged helix-turn-helix (wHTH) protein/TolB-like protein